MLLNGPQGLTRHCLRTFSVSSILNHPSWKWAYILIFFFLCVHSPHSLPDFSLYVYSFIAAGPSGTGKARTEAYEELRPWLLWWFRIWPQGTHSSVLLSELLERDVLSSAGTLNLADWSWSCWWLTFLPLWKKSLPEHEERRGGPRRAEAAFWTHCRNFGSSQLCQMHL